MMGIVFGIVANPLFALRCHSHGSAPGHSNSRCCICFLAMAAPSRVVVMYPPVGRVAGVWIPSRVKPRPVPLWRRHGAEPGLDTGSVVSSAAPDLDAGAVVDENELATKSLCFQ